MLDFIIGFACGTVITLALALVAARALRRRITEHHSRVQDAIMTDLAARSRSASNPFPVGEDFVRRYRQGRSPAS